MKLIVEFELGESWETYHSNDEQRLEALLRDDLDEVKAMVVKSSTLPDINNSTTTITSCLGCVREKFPKGEGTCLYCDRYKLYKQV